MKSNNWIKLYRRIKESPLYPNKKFTKFEVFIDILLNVAWENCEREVAGEKVKLKPGQWAASQRFLAKRWGLSVGTVSNYLNDKKLNTTLNTYLNTKLNTQISVISVINWSDYQGRVEQVVEQGLEKKLNEFKEYYKNNYKNIVSCLNLNCKTNFRETTQKTKDLVMRRIKDGFVYSDFESVIKWTSVNWLGDPKMENYLRPETIFGNKFEGYLEASKKKNSKSYTKAQSKFIGEHLFEFNGRGSCRVKERYDNGVRVNNNPEEWIRESEMDYNNGYKILN